MKAMSLRTPSAVAPMLMSLVALAVVVSHLLFVGSAREIDEGISAHVFQLLIALQLPIVAFFAVKWLPREPARALMMMSLQAAAALVALAPVVIFDL
jgi:hypothetical protein